MAKLTSRIIGALNEGREQKKTKVQKDKSHKAQDTQTTDLEFLREESLSYEEFKQLWERRAAVKQVQPYVDHIELFLGLIEPEYNLEIQKELVAKAIGEVESNFAVSNSNVNFNWQLTDDRKETVNGQEIPNPFAIKALYGTLQEHFKTIYLKNLRGANPCIAINKLRGPARSNTNVESIRAIWLEDDNINAKPRTAIDDENPLPLPPSFIVESSKGKFHYYWLTSTDDFNTWQRIQKEVMTERLGSDPGANGLNRAMRIPGFWHSKGRPFATRIVYLLSQSNIPITPQPSKEFLEFAKDHAAAKTEYAFDTYLAGKVKRYSWEDIVDAFGRFLPEKPLYSDGVVSDFDPISTMERIFQAEDYHASLHALCMHFANYQQDSDYITYIVQSLMCRVPENKRDNRWHSRFNDIGRSSQAAVTKKLTELANETLISNINEKPSKFEKGIHDDDWPLPFPDIKGGCEPLDMLMADFASSSDRPIRSFNFASAMSFFTLCLQNIPIMPVMGERTANGCHLLLAPSTDGKDLNVSMPIKSLARSLKKGYLSETDLSSREVLQGLEPTGEITSLSAFQQWAESPWRVKGGIWINTECTSQIGKMSDENLNVSNLAEVVINVQDGTPIPTVTKAAKRADQLSISKPLHEAYCLLFATQPASIKKYMTPNLLYKGVIGRFDYYISDQPPLPADQQVSTLSATTLRSYYFRPELLEFLAWMLKQCCAQREGCIDGYARRVRVLYDEGDENRTDHTNGPRRQKHVDWDLRCKKNEEWQVEDSQFKTFIDRVPMSTERWATILTAVQHLWECYKKKVVPFQDALVINDKILDIVCKLGEYQYDVRFFRIWPLIGSTRGLDDKHKIILEAIQKADKNMTKWLKFVSQNHRQAHKVLFEKEFYIPIRAVARLIPYDANIPTKDLIPSCITLSSMGLVEFVQVKQMDARICNKPLKNVVRLTAEGRL